MSYFHRIKGFANGIIIGSVISSLVIIALLYVLNMTEVIVFSIPYMPDVQQMLFWVYDNLRLSLVFFGLIFVCYWYQLNKLNRQLQNPGVDSATVMQSENLVDIWIGLFFGIGVIWTAIGMRSALLSALGGLDATTAAEEGAFAILQRLVDGGILLSLSTTIFGGVGGYVMRVYKTIRVGTGMQNFYLTLQDTENEQLHTSLVNIEQQLVQLNNHFINQQPAAVEKDEHTLEMDFGPAPQGASS
jgi:hypothetical protein